jgi:hypothetical protein
MPLMYQQNTLQMEWCLNCHRDPAKNLRPVSQVYNMAWEGPTSDKPVWCSVSDEKSGKPTAQSVDCQTTEPGKTEVASLDLNALKLPGMSGLAMQMSGATTPAIAAPASYTKFTSQRELGNYLIDHYKIRKPNELSSCEVCHR